MALYAVVDMDGKVLRTGSCPIDMLEIQASDGETAISTDISINDESYYFKNGEAKEYPPKPTKWHTFDFSSETWGDFRSPAQLAADLLDAKTQASSKVVTWAQGLLDQFTAGYPTQETLAWSSKLAAARLVLDGASDPMISTEAAMLGVTAFELAAKVKAKGELFERIVAATSAIRSMTQAQIAHATSEAHISQIMAAAMQSAGATLSKLKTG